MADTTSFPGPVLYDGEVLADVNNFPSIHHFSPPATLGSTSSTPLSVPSSPLVVCVVGGLHLGRIFHGGHGGYAPQDFLAYWLNQNGYSVLSLSYPLETDPEIMPPTAANFRIGDWGDQAAVTTRKIIDDYKLPNTSVILVSWSMAGRMVVPFNIAATSLGLDVRLYISFAATPGFSSLRPLPVGMQCSSNGYWWVPSLLDSFRAQMNEMRRINGGRVIVPKDIYLKEYTGKSPINLIGLQQRFDRERGTFVRDKISHERDTLVLDVANFPLIAGIVPESILDPSHALGDRAAWGFLLTYKIESMIGGIRLTEAHRRGTWENMKLLVRNAPERFFVEIQGNHFFFVGEAGAKATAEAVVKLIKEAESFRQELDELTKVGYETRIKD